MVRTWREGISSRRKLCEGHGGLRRLGRFGESFSVDSVVSHSVEIRLEKEVVVRSRVLLSVHGWTLSQQYCTGKSQTGFEQRIDIKASAL